MNLKQRTLDRLSIGAVGVVERLTAGGAEKCRMQDLGIVPGAEIKALHKSPAGDPTAYSIMGAVIAIRNADAAKIIIT